MENTNSNCSFKVSNIANYILTNYNPVDYCGGIYNTRGSDEAEFIKSIDGAHILYCFEYSYFDIIGISDDELNELNKLLNIE